MKDHLLSFCNKVNIEVIYNEDNNIILSNSLEGNIPTIKLHKIFKNCPQIIANAIIDYYIKFKNENKSFEIINDYANDLLTVKNYKIQPPDKKFKNFIQKYILPPIKESKDDTSLMELKISSITKKDFFGEENEISPDDSIYASSDSPVELDIIVDDFDS